MSEIAPSAMDGAQIDLEEAISAANGNGERKDKPILFSGPMVRALLEGRKTQTRRVLKGRKDVNFGCELAPCELAGEINNGDYDNSPFAPGDLLWVRETWTARMTHGWTIADARSRMYQEQILYRADDGESIDGWWPSIHMPREFSRLTLEVTGVRVERLQDISEEDAEAEGVTKVKDHCYVVRGFGYDEAGLCHSRATIPFAQLWDSLNEPRGFGWEANPWVVAVSFRVHHANVDDVLAKIEEAA